MRNLNRDRNVELSQENLSLKLGARNGQRAATRPADASPPARTTSVLEQLSAAARDALEAFPKNRN